MRLKFLWLAMGGVMFANVGWTQSYPESALLFSRINPGGSARIQGMGSAQTALGGDFSSAYSNPAGLGMYNRSEISASIGIQNTNINSKYFDNAVTDNRANFNLPALGAVFCSSQRNEEGYIGGSFAITYNRVNNFNQDIKYAGTNQYNSLIDRCIAQAADLKRRHPQRPPTPTEFRKDNYYNYLAGMAYRNFLISDSTEARPRASNTDFFSVMGTFNANDIRRQLQQEDVVRSGSQSQLSISYGGNFNDRIFIGAGLGIALFDYTNVNAYTESNFSFDREPTYRPLDRFTLNETLIMKGIGINLALGLMARPIDAVQLGLSYVTPTSYAISETYQGAMNSVWNDYKYNSLVILKNISTTTDELKSDYSLKTPARLNGGITFFIKKTALITADVQVTDYSGAKYGAQQSGPDFSEDNANIKNGLKRVFNFHAGSEYRFNNSRIRAGYGMMPDPFNRKSFNISQAISSYSLGAGYRIPRKATIDIAAILTRNNYVYLPYRLNSPYSPFVNSTSQNISVVITASFPL